MIEAHIDIETASECDLRACGLDVYARHPTTRILMVTWKVGTVYCTWTCAESWPPGDLLYLLVDPNVRKWAHNAQFEMALFEHVWDVEIDVTQWRCTMTWAYMLGLPGALADLGDVLLLPNEMKKSKDGWRLMKLFSTPQKITKKNPHRWHSATTRPIEWKQFVDYNRQDVVAEGFIAEERLHRFTLPDSEWDDWHLDQQINRRGLPIDRTLVGNACAMVTTDTATLMDKLEELTGLDNPNSDKQFGPWIRARGFPYGDLKKASVQKVLDDPAYDEDLKEPLRLRSGLKMASVSKYFAVDLMAHSDDRLRFTLQFCGASRTGRWAGRGGAHFHNPKKPPKDLEHYVPDIVESIRANEIEWLREMYGDPVKACSAVVRAIIRAHPGKKLVVADLASIESCTIAWLARCESMLKVFYSGLDIYRVFATRMFGKEYAAITKAERNLAKPPVLGCGFRLSGGEDMISPKTGDAIKTGLYGYAENMGIPMTRDEAHFAVTVFREAYPEVVQFWYDIEAAVMHVLQRGGEAEVGHLRFDVLGPFLRMILPSGRALHYLRPKIEKRMMPWGKEKWSITFEGIEDLGEGRSRWGRQATHGGKLCENATQAVANDILRCGLRAATRVGFEIVGHSHDEAIAEIDEDSILNVEDLCGALTEDLPWCVGLPLGAAGYQAIVYRKD